jgi:hypothetical protein
VEAFLGMGSPHIASERAEACVLCRYPINDNIASQVGSLRYYYTVTLVWRGLLVGPLRTQYDARISAMSASLRVLPIRILFYRTKAIIMRRRTITRKRVVTPQFLNDNTKKCDLVACHGRSSVTTRHWSTFGRVIRRPNTYE